MSPVALQKDYCWVLSFVVVFLWIPPPPYPLNYPPRLLLIYFFFFYKRVKFLMTWAPYRAFKGPWSCFSGPLVRQLLITPAPQGLGTSQSQRHPHRRGAQRRPVWARDASPARCVDVWCSSLSYSCLLGLGSRTRAQLPWRPSQMDVLFWIPSSTHPKAAKTQTFSLASQLWER